MKVQFVLVIICALILATLSKPLGKIRCYTSADKTSSITPATKSAVTSVNPPLNWFEDALPGWSVDAPVTIPAAKPVSATESAVTSVNPPLNWFEDALPGWSVETPVTIPAAKPVSATESAVTSVNPPLNWFEDALPGWSVDAPVAASVDKPVSVPKDTPVTISAAKPVSVPVNTPIGAINFNPPAVPVNSFMNRPTTTFFAKPATVPVNSFGNAPVTTSFTKPTTVPVNSFGNAPVTTSFTKPTTVPVNSFGNAPATTSFTKPTTVPVNSFGNAPITTSFFKPVTVSVDTPIIPSAPSLPTIESTVEPVVELITEPDVELTTQPVVEPITELDTKPVNVSVSVTNPELNEGLVTAVINIVIQYPIEDIEDVPENVTNTGAQPNTEKPPAEKLKAFVRRIISLIIDRDYDGIRFLINSEFKCLMQKKLTDLDRFNLRKQNVINRTSSPKRKDADLKLLQTKISQYAEALTLVYDDASMKFKKSTVKLVNRGLPQLSPSDVIKRAKQIYNAVFDPVKVSEKILAAAKKEINKIFL